MDKDGYITNGELFNVLKMMVGNNLKDAQLQQIVDKTIIFADSDGDGKISFEEFCAVREICHAFTSGLCYDCSNLFILLLRLAGCRKSRLLQEDGCGSVVCDVSAPSITSYNLSSSLNNNLIYRSPFPPAPTARASLAAGGGRAAATCSRGQGSDLQLSRSATSRRLVCHQVGL